MNVGRFALLLPLAMFAGEAPASASASLRWEEAFGTSTAPTNVYFEARYLEGGRSHRLKVWRQGKTQVRRETDGWLNVYAVRQPGGEVQYRIIDLRYRQSIRITRENLYRIGAFSDWWSLAHVLTRPYGDITIAAQGKRRERTKHGACRWYELEGAQVCWSDAWGLPLLIRDGNDDGAPARFEVTAVRRFSPKAVSLRMPDKHVIDINANLDIDPSED